MKTIKGERKKHTKTLKIQRGECNSIQEPTICHFVEEGLKNVLEVLKPFCGFVYEKSAHGNKETNISVLASQTPRIAQYGLKVGYSA
jgi:hypothetical protein